jgi:hypothetical protein
LVVKLMLSCALRLTNRDELRLSQTSAWVREGGDLRTRTANRLGGRVGTDGWQGLPLRDPQDSCQAEHTGPD